MKARFIWEVRLVMITLSLQVILHPAAVRPDAAGNLRPEEGWAGHLSDRICGPSYAGPAHHPFADQSAGSCDA